MLPYSVIHVYTNEEARAEGRPFREAVVEYVRSLHIAARCLVTVATEGCYESGDIATRRIEVLAHNMPVKIEIVLPSSETPPVLAHIEDMATDAIVAVSDLTVTSHKLSRQLLPRNLRVKDAMTTSPRSVTPEMPILAIVQILVAEQYNSVPVVDIHNAPIGIITQGDLIRRAGMPVRLGILGQFRHKDLTALSGVLTAHKASDVMSAPVVMVNESDLLTNAVRIMLSKGLKRLPVVNSNGELAGMLARLDIFNVITDIGANWQALEASHVSLSAARTVKDIMRSDAHAVSPETSMEEVIHIIDSNDIQRVAVVDSGGKLVGMLSDRDLLGVFAEHKANLWQHLLARLPFAEATRRAEGAHSLSRSTSVAKVMRTDLVTVTESATIDEAIRVMAEKSVKRLPVVDDQRRFKGMISRDSVLRAGFEARAEEGTNMEG